MPIFSPDIFCFKIQLENVDDALATNLVQNPDFTDTGAELVTNGGFVNGSDWTAGAGWTLGGGVASWDAPNTYAWISQTIGNYVGKSLSLTFDAVINSGDLRVVVANGGATPSITTSGSYEFILYPTGGGAYDSLVRVYQTVADSDFTITNISIKELGGDWVVNTGWSIGDSVAISDGSSSLSIYQAITSAVEGKHYKVTYEVVSISQGGFEFEFGDIRGVERTTAGVFTEYVTAISTDKIRIYPKDSAIGSISNISVVETSTVSDEFDSIGDIQPVKGTPCVSGM